MSAVVVSHQELIERLAAPTAPCRFCGKRYKARNGGRQRH